MKKNRNYRSFTPLDLGRAIGLLIILAVWVLVLFNPVFIAIHYSNPLYLFLYVLLPAEFFVGALISGFIFTILDR